MRFCVVALSPVPDVSTARRTLALPDLGDEAVAKVLFHQRSQQPGERDGLRWDQQMIAAMTLIQHSVDAVHVETMGLTTQTEDELLGAFFTAVLRNGRMVTWDGSRHGLPLIHFRAMLHQVSFPAYWQAHREAPDLHVELSPWLASQHAERPPLDETARIMGLPGMLDRRAEDLVEAWLANDQAPLRAFSDLTALNTYLLALRAFSLTGEMSRYDSARAIRSLHEQLGRHDEDHLAAFAAAWGAD